MKRVPRLDEPTFPSVAELPFYERDPAQTCSTCAHLVRLKQHPLDLDGQLQCKEGPPAITTLPAQGGTAQLASSFVPAHPLQWCFRWADRQWLDGIAAPEKSVLQG
jgi:hypothetical protein